MKYILILLVTSVPQIISAQENLVHKYDELVHSEKTQAQAPEFHNLEQAAAWADLVAVAQVDDIEYKKVRNLNSQGYAYLNILIPYKGATRGEPIAVIAKGFDDNICYYPDRENEGERFLVFLKKAPGEKENVYYGFKPYCQIQILLSKTGQYIVRTPLDNHVVDLNQEIIQTYNFNDPHAMIDATLWTGTQREDYAKEYQCKIIQSEDEFNKYFHLRYTQGVPISKIRELLKLKYVPRMTSDQI